jgi:hypothetical protein
MCGESRAFRISARSFCCIERQAHEISSPQKVFPATNSLLRAQQQWRIEAIHEVVAVSEVVIEEEVRLVLVEEVEVN